MKEVFEKIIERLEEEHKLAEEDAERYEKGNSNHFKYAKARGYVNAMEVAIEIVNQVAEEYVPDINVGEIEEFCEWIETIFLTFTDCGKSFDNSKLYYDEYVFCPYCGKKIKAVE